MAAHSCLYHSRTTPFLLTKKESIQVIPKPQMSAFRPSRKFDHQAAWQFVVSDSRSLIDLCSQPFSRTNHTPAVALGIRDVARDRIWGLRFVNHLRFWRSFENLMKTSDPLPRKPCGLARNNVTCLEPPPRPSVDFLRAGGLRSIVIF